MALPNSWAYEYSPLFFSFLMQPCIIITLICKDYPKRLHIPSTFFSQLEKSHKIQKNGSLESCFWFSRSPQPRTHANTSYSQYAWWPASSTHRQPTTKRPRPSDATWIGWSGWFLCPGNGHVPAATDGWEQTRAQCSGEAIESHGRRHRSHCHQWWHHHGGRVQWWRQRKWLQQWQAEKPPGKDGKAEHKCPGTTKDARFEWCPWWAEKCDSLCPFAFCAKAVENSHLAAG